MISESLNLCSFCFIKHTSADIVHSKFAANLNDCNEVLRLVCLWLRRPFHFKKRVVMLNMGTRPSIKPTHLWKLHRINALSLKNHFLLRFGYNSKISFWFIFIPNNKNNFKKDGMVLLRYKQCSIILYVLHFFCCAANENKLIYYQ